MGKRGGKPFFRGGGRGHGRGGGGGGGGQGRHTQRQAYAEVVKKNQNFETYYNELGVAGSTEEERDEFWTALRRELPNSFRFAGSKGHALAVQQRLVEHYIPEITKVEWEGQFVTPPQPIAWFPDQLAWHMTTPKNVVRKFPPFASFQKFLVSETSVGNISRQEVVSMIPPLLMDLEPGMTVLDLCAAPGSKSAQLIELVHGGEESRIRKVLMKLRAGEEREMSSDGIEMDFEEEQAKKGDWSDDGRSTGLLVANDVDYKRAQMLVHQVKRLNSPNLIVTNHDATMFPSIQLPSEQGVQNRYLKFDRILADVPCSGDGTPRKNPNVWKDWIPGNGLGLHPTQVRILVRALQMLKVGGRAVYSTCSMNPVENEAVVASAIDRCGGLEKVRIVDHSRSLSGLKRNHGLKTWKVMDKAGRLWSTWAEVEEHRKTRGEDGLGKLTEGMFSPASRPNQDIPLDRCFRIYPHQQDTGGFFIAVLEKQSEIRARPEAEAKIKTAASAPLVKPSTSTSIVDVVNEIEAQSTTKDEPGLEKIEALDGLAPPHPIGEEAENPSAAARQNEENHATAEPVRTSLKRGLENGTEAYNSNKRMKTKENVEDIEIDTEADRMVHYPPPPAATDIPDDIPSPSPATPDTPAMSASNPNQKRRNDQPHEEPFKYLNPDHEELQGIYKFYELHGRFPRDRFMVRNAAGHPAKAIYYTSALARDILRTNEGKGIKFIHAGVKMFMKQDAQGQNVCRWRIQNEGLPIIEGWVGESRVVKLWNRETLRRLLMEMFPKVAGEGWKTLGEIGERCRDIGMGCCVLRVERGDGDDGFKERMVLPLWRSISSLNLMLPKEDRKAMLLRLYNDDSPLVDNSKGRLQQSQQQEQQNGTANTSSTPSSVPLESAAPTDDATFEDAMDEEGGSDGGGFVREETGRNGLAGIQAPQITRDEIAQRIDKVAANVERDGVTGDESGAVAEQKTMQYEDVLKGDAVRTEDNRREMAPGVDDEEDVFNKTV